MLKYMEALEELPKELKGPLVKVLEFFREEVVETVKKSDFERFEKATEENFNRVWRSIEELAEAQKRTEQRVEELAEAQKRTEQRVEELAEAQKRTENELRSLIKSHKELREEVGGLGHTVGYRLEDESFKALPPLLRRDKGVEIKERLKRDFIEIAPDRYIEVNIWGEGRYDGKECVVVGEARSQLKKKDVDDFIKRADDLKKYVPKEQVRILVTYQASPQVQRYAKEKNIKIYFSYEF